MIRKVVAVLLGMLCAAAVITAVEMASSGLHPLPQGADPADREVFARYVAALPVAAFLAVLGGYVAGSFTGGLVSTLVGGRASLRPAIVVGAILTAGGLANLIAIPHPLWFAVLSTLVYIPFALLGGRLLLRRRPAVERGL